MKPEDMVLGETYKFTGQPTKLKYVGHNLSGNGYWHQFEKVDKQGVWCELISSDLYMIELAVEIANSYTPPVHKNIIRTRLPSAMTRNQRKRKNKK